MKKAFVSSITGQIRRLARVGARLALRSHGGAVGHSNSDHVVIRVPFGVSRGVRMAILPATDSLGWALGTWEPEVQRLIRMYAPWAGCCWDVGANVGTHTLAMARCVGPRGVVHAFEPGSWALSRLRENAHLNPRYPIRVHPVALGSKDCRASLRIPTDGGASMASLVWHRSGSVAAVEEVVVASGDGFLSARLAEPPDLLKVDVEGSEGSVLLGLAVTLRTHKPVVLLEVSEAGREAAWQTLCDCDYTVRSVDRAHRRIQAYSEFRHRDVVAIPPGHQPRARAGRVTGGARASRAAPAFPTARNPSDIAPGGGELATPVRRARPPG